MIDQAEIEVDIREYEYEWGWKPEAPRARGKMWVFEAIGTDLSKVFHGTYQEAKSQAMDWARSMNVKQLKLWP